MTNTTLVPPATPPTPATAANRPFTPATGSLNAVEAAAAVVYELEAIADALHGAVPLVTSRLQDARERLNATLDAWMGRFPC